MLMTCIEASFLFSCILAFGLREPLFQQNLFQVAIATSLFSFWALRTYTHHKEESIYMEEVSRIKEPMDVLILLSLLNQSLCQPTSESQIILLNLKTNHLLQCARDDCFCRQAKGNELCKRLVLEKVEELMEDFERDVAVMIVSINLKLELFEVYVDSYYAMLAFKKKVRFSWSEQAAFQSFHNELSTYIQRKNSNFEIVETEKALGLQAIIERIEDMLEGLLSNKNHFWRAISKRAINQQEMEGNLQAQLATIKQAEQGMLRQIEEYGDNPQMIILFSYMTLSIQLKEHLPSKLKAKLKALEHKRSVSLEKLLLK